MEDTENKRLKRYILSGVVVIIMIVIVFFVVRGLNSNGVFTGDITLSFTELTDMESTAFTKYGDGFLKIRQDGTEAIDSKGKKLWNIAYSIVNPIADVCGECAVIADKGNRNMYITDGTGEQTDITTEYAIVEAEVAKQGVTAVWTSNNEEDKIYLFDITGKKLLEIVTGIIREGTPIDISLSDDGQKLAVSYLTVENTNVRNWVTLYNFGDVGQNYTDKIVGSFSYNGVMVPKVEFLNDMFLCVYKDNGFVLYKVKELPELIFEETTEENICSIVTSDKYIMMVTSSSKDLTRKIKIFDMAGKKVTETLTDIQYRKAAIFNESYVLYDERDIDFFHINGSEKYVKSTVENIKMITECRDSDEYIIVQDKIAETIELNKNGKDELEDTEVTE